MPKTMLDYIRESHTAVLQNIDNSEKLTRQFVDNYMECQNGRLVLVASGSSYNGAVCAKPFMEKMLGKEVTVMPPYTFVNYGFEIGKNDMVAVVSQSGGSTNSIAALKKIKELGLKTIGITGNLESDFKDYSDVLIEYGVGIETVGFVTKGVMTLALYLMLSALEIAKKLGRVSGSEYGAWLEKMRKAASTYPSVEKKTLDFIEKNKKVFTSMKQSYLIGAGPGFGIALEGALKEGETVKIPTFAYELDEFVHGPNFQLNPDYTVTFVDCDMKTHDRLLQLADATFDVTDRVFILSLFGEKQAAGGALKGKTLMLDADDIDPFVSVFTLLPYFQLVSYDVSERLNSWKGHPLFADFETKSGFKSERHIKMREEQKKAGL
ncbi:MAG: SIS domain-containing protein [Bacillota bacterium]|nr:SIS domain-containing protein [Bacillota bacterium]